MAPADRAAPESVRRLAHFGDPQTWYSRHAPDAAKARILRGRIRHADDVLRFFANHPRLARLQAGKDARWQHGRMGRWARKTLAAVLWRPPLLAGEREWHATLKNVVNRNLLRLARCETGYLDGGRINWSHSNSQYVSGLGFAWSTWRHYRHRVRPLPPSDGAKATPAEQLAVGRALVREFHGYSSWPSCSIRLGLR